ncbi:MAG: glycosyltransferase family 4 protein, partial [candidate division Zixibacteria bacterium]|nr:glycosyltransferase family 4 protein [candidate division Zixibacteria bacterium]
MIGQKGLPATYGGIEHHVENLSAGLASLGHDITVYCRPYYSLYLDSNSHIEKINHANYRYRDVNLKLIRSLKTKHLDAITHSLLSILHAIKSDFDIIHIHGIGPSLVGFIPRLAGKKLIATVHALDYRQKKWGGFARLCLKTGLKSSVVYPTRTICVSRTIQEYLGNPPHSVYAPNGVKEPDLWDQDDLDWIESRGLKPGKYILFVGRLIEDKNCHLLTRALRRLKDGWKLAVAGDSSFTDDYVEKLKREAGEETVFLGNVYNGRLSALYANCALFVLPSSVEGLPIVLIEAMKHKAPALASDIP